MTRLALLAIALLAVPVAAGAQAPPAAPPRMEGNADAAFVGNTGNASTSTFGVGGSIVNRPDQWLLKDTAAFTRNRTGSVLTAESWTAESRVEHQASGRLSVFGDYVFLRDRFAGVAARHSPTSGLTWKMLTGATQNLSVDAGLGYLHERRLDGPSLSSGTFTAAAAYRWHISPTADLTDDLNVIESFDHSDDWRLSEAVNLTARLTTVFSLKVGSVIRYAHVPAPGFKPTDTTTSIALVASFKRPGP